MRVNKNRQTAGWVKQYRFFLCLLLLTVLLLVGGFYYSFCERANTPKEGTLVRRMTYEGKA
ncbi:MAG: hypothetical protein NC355_07895 [Blautia sp.]|nr:hypothetical protein [Blautia sp.]